MLTCLWLEKASLLIHLQYVLISKESGVTNINSADRQNNAVINVG